MQVNTEGNTSTQFYVNRNHDNTNNSYVYHGRGFSSVTAMEVSA